MIDTSTWDEETLERRVGLLRLLVGTVFVLGFAALAGALGTVLVIASVMLMIMLHELGHFLTAKWAGMKVTEFFVGFGRRLWSVRKGETEYGIKATPFLGGYCKIPGMTNLEEIDPEDEPRTYRQKSFPRRLSVAVAGSVMHFILAFLLLFGLHVVVGFDQPVRRIGEISRLETGPSPAQRAGFRIGDEIVAVDGRKLEHWDDLPPYIRANPEKPIKFDIVRDGEPIVLTAVPVDLSEVKVAGRPSGVAVAEPTGFIGVGPAMRVERANGVVGVGRAVRDLGTTVVLTGGALRQLLSLDGLGRYGDELFGSGPSRIDADDPAPRFLSPVGLVRVAGQAADDGARTILYLLISINVFVGIFNMIPLLPLDGGHVAIAVYERIREGWAARRRYHADVAKLVPTFYAMLLILATLAITSLYLDIARPLTFN